MISYWGIDHGDVVSKGSRKKYDKGSPARDWRMGSSLEAQGMRGTPGAVRNMTSAANKAARKQIDRGPAVVAGGAAAGAGTGALVGRKLGGSAGTLPGAAVGTLAGVNAGVIGNTVAAFKGQNNAFRAQLDREYKRGRVKYEVKKSYLGGGRWASATQAGAKRLKNAKGAHKQAKGLSLDARAAKMRLVANKEISDINNLVTPGKTKYTVTDQLPPGKEGLTVLHGGRRSKTRSVLINSGNNPAERARIKTHETAHAAPKRSSYRLDQIMQNPSKLGREEARADMAQGSYYNRSIDQIANQMKREGGSGSGYMVSAFNVSSRNPNNKPRGIMRKRPFSPNEVDRAYMDTQDKIARARVKKSYMYVPTSAKERRRERRKNVTNAAVGSGVLSGALTAGLNAGGGRAAMARGGLQMGVLGAGIGAGFGAAQKPRQGKYVRVRRQR